MIVSAAVKFILDDYIGTEVTIPVHRHKDGILICEKLLGYKPVCSGEGFLTDDGTYLDRATAVEHAYVCGQLDWMPEWDRESTLASECLMSEDLW